MTAVDLDGKARNQLFKHGKSKRQRLVNIKALYVHSLRMEFK